jgi:hypothetical protein
MLKGRKKTRQQESRVSEYCKSAVAVKSGEMSNQLIEISKCQ